MRALIWIGLIALAVLASPAGAEEPMKSGDTLIGKLRLVKTKHPNGTPIEAYQVVSAPRQMPTSDSFCADPYGKAKTFHLFSMTEQDKGTLSRLVGKTVRVKVWELFCSQNAWHIGDVAVNKWSW